MGRTRGNGCISGLFLLLFWAMEKLVETIWVFTTDYYSIFYR